ncbi:hypothetical protein K488DRAFT_26548, partial [Vararia minispora EC-137]
APPPWLLKASSWVLKVKISPSNADNDSDSIGENSNSSPAILQGFPPGAYPPFENIHESALEEVDGRPQRRGTSASVCILRCSDSPVGPYDELILLPGGFRNPRTRDVTSRISSAYVSSESSAWNGRRNWNIPKHLARFEWEPAGPRRTILRVYHHADAPSPFSTTKPFFTATLSNARFLGVYIPPVFLGKRSWMIQPPLNEGVSAIAVSTLSWLSITPKYKGRWSFGYAEPVSEDRGGLPAFGDGVSFPKLVLASKRGMTFKGDLVFVKADDI